MNTALAVTLAAHLVSAGCHAAVPLFHDVTVVKPYQQSAAVSYQPEIAPASPPPIFMSGAIPARQTARRPASLPIPYRGTAPLPGFQGTRAPGVFARQQSALQAFTGQRLRDAGNTNLGHASTFRRR